MQSRAEPKFQIPKRSVRDAGSRITHHTSHITRRCICKSKQDTAAHYYAPRTTHHTLRRTLTSRISANDMAAPGQDDNCILLDAAALPVASREQPPCGLLQAACWALHGVASTAGQWLAASTGR
ncbi:hypothetical protein G7Z17_g10777 [Cylindrodendrum hubeiense]|uniref:Uncharacterized protein n=1 Tax=Cylindrodendrum hubeiense TaxID=595255 RepID=A0A9P5GY85_9HYPO|nr:hypothetical protein G7Z17_g10777 [Cylindrodendrum hubeiense]